MKGFVYILELKNSQFYVGSTGNIERRYCDHCAGRVKSTKYKLPAKLVFHQMFDNLKIARQTEYKIKTYKSRKFIEEILQKGKINLPL